MSRASEAFEALSLAMLSTDPACQNDERFTDDHQPADELAPICELCPLVTMCAEFARLDRPMAGIWAGKRWSTKKGTTDDA